MDATFYTLLLQAGSFYVDADTRERVLRAQRLGASEVSISPARRCAACRCDHATTIDLRDVLGFIAHDSARDSAPHGNVVPLRVLA